MKTLQKQVLFGLILFTNFNLHTYAQNKTITYVGDTGNRSRIGVSGLFFGYAAAA